MVIITPIGELLQYADSVHIPHHISVPFLKQVLKWEGSCGKELTVNRVKQLKQAILQVKAGTPIHFPWLATDSNGIPKGPVKGLVTWAGSSPKRWSKIIHLMQVYTYYYSASVTPKQEEKFLRGVTSPSKPVPDLLLDGVRKAARIICPSIKLGRPKAYLSYPFSSTRRCPLPDGKTYPEDDVVLEGLTFLGNTKFGVDSFWKYPNIFVPLLDGINIDQLVPGRSVPRTGFFCSKNWDPSLSLVGKVSFIQEPGFKLRAVANPARVFQAALQPLGSSLFDLCRELPWDCTHNQSKADFFILRSLRERRTCYSVDLRGATDYFPLDLQMKVLEEIYPDSDYVRLFKDISRGDWFYKDTTIRWTTGQPLGLYPSFPAFAITHGLLLYYLNDFRHNDAFFVLGDDVVILDQELHTKYRISLDLLGCPISAEKTFQSDKLVEFAGKIFLFDRKMNQFKWRLVSDDSFVDFVRNIGPGAVRFLRKRQRAIIQKLWHVPDFLGGLGFNPKGIPLEDRLPPEKDKIRNFLMSYNGIINKWMYNPPKSYTKIRLPILDRFTLPDFDQKSVALVQRFLPNFLYWYEILGINLGSLRDDNHQFVVPDGHLRIQGRAKSISLLEQLEHSVL
jgi:hypothetical protein